MPKLQTQWTSELQFNLFEAGEDIYTSTDLQTGINRVALTKWASLIKDLMELDPRGGHYGTPDMDAALETAARSNDAALAMFKDKSEAAKKTIDEYFANTSYALGSTMYTDGPLLLLL